MTNRFNNEFISATLTEAADIAATRISQNYALNCIAEKGSCTLEEAQNMYELAHRVITEGAEDLIPENLELPDAATDDVDPTAGQDAAVDADVEGADDGDLDLSDLEGIVLPDSEGNQYIIQGGILVPYEEDEGDDAVTAAGDTPNDDGDVDPTTQSPEGQDLEESTTNVEGNVEAITESTDNVNSIFTNNSSIVSNILKNVNFAK